MHNNWIHIDRVRLRSSKSFAVCSEPYGSNLWVLYGLELFWSAYGPHYRKPADLGIREYRGQPVDGPHHACPSRYDVVYDEYLVCPVYGLHAEGVIVVCCPWPLFWQTVC